MQTDRGLLLVGLGRNFPKQSIKKQNGHISRGGEAWEATVKGSWTQAMCPNRCTRCTLEQDLIHPEMLGGRTWLSPENVQRLLMCWHLLCAFRTALVEGYNIWAQVGVLGECTLGTSTPL